MLQEILKKCKDKYNLTILHEILKNCKSNIKKRCLKIKDKIKKLKFNFKKRVSSFYKKYQIKIDWSIEFFMTAFLYGIVLNFIVYTLFGLIGMGFRNIMAMGFLFYFIKEEMPRIIVKCKTLK